MNRVAILLDGEFVKKVLHQRTRRFPAPHRNEPMHETLQALESAALLLPAHQRARLAQRLLASFDIDPEVEAAWADEVRRRLEEWEKGRTEEIPADEVLAQVRDRFGSPLDVSGVEADVRRDDILRAIHESRERDPDEGSR